jgi:hypothetical protein
LQSEIIPIESERERERRRVKKNKACVQSIASASSLFFPSADHRVFREGRKRRRKEERGSSNSILQCPQRSILSVIEAGSLPSLSLSLSLSFLIMLVFYPK